MDGREGPDADGDAPLPHDAPHDLPGEHILPVESAHLPPFEWRRHPGVLVLFAALAVVFIPGLVALALSDDAPPLNRHVSSTDAITGAGPLDAGKITAQARVVDADSTQTFLVTIENTGDLPAVLLDAHLETVDQGLTVVGLSGIPVDDPNSTTTTPTTVVTTAPGSSPTTTVPAGVPIVGYVIPPSDQAPPNQVNGIELDLRLDRHGKFGAYGLTLVYSSGGIVYTQTIWNSWGLCTDVPLHDCYPVTLDDLTQRATDATSTTTAPTVPPAAPTP